jgi:hypothetical protein
MSQTQQNLAVVFCGNTLGVITRLFGDDVTIRELASAGEHKARIRRPYADKTIFNGDQRFMRPATAEDFDTFGVPFTGEYQVNWSLTDIEPTCEYQHYLRQYGLYTLFQLPLAVQEKALANALSRQVGAVERALAQAKADIRENLHWCINNPYFISRLIPSRRILKSMQQSRDYLINMTVGNHTEFFADGSKMSFHDNKLMRYDDGVFYERTKAA